MDKLEHNMKILEVLNVTCVKNFEVNYTQSIVCGLKQAAMSGKNTPQSSHKQARRRYGQRDQVLFANLTKLVALFDILHKEGLGEFDIMHEFNQFDMTHE